MSSPNSSLRPKLVIAAILAAPLTAAAILPPWLQHIRADATFEAALYRMMDLPGVHVFFPRPPKESVAELNKLPASPALYSLRAHQEEQALDFIAAESDWKAFAAASPDNRIELANFYHRRLAVKPEFATLLEVASSPAPASEAFTAPAQQRSWQAFERALTLANDQSFDDATTLGLYKSWIARYPQQPTVYARAITWALDQKRFPDAESILAQYKTAFPTDQVFPIKAAALLALKRGGPDAQHRALSVYDAAFQPLWPDALVSSYFSLLSNTHNLRHFQADANARLQRNPDDLNALGRIFLYNQNQSHTDAALSSLDQYRRSKEARKAPWTAAELDTLAQLTLAAHDAPDAARYDFALYSMAGNLPDGRVAKETGLSNMIALLLSTPDKPITLGAGNLSMYRDIATLDRGPGYWNGILSLWFNSTSPNNEFADEEKKAQPYFQRAKAAELLTLLDREAPNAPQRATLHAQLLQVYADYGDNAAVSHEGSTLLAQFPDADSTFRLGVAMTLADAYARQNDSASEFALYDRTLAELGPRAKNMPLSSATYTAKPATPPPPAASDTDDDNNAKPAAKAPDAAPAFQLDTGAPSTAPHPDADAYAQVFDRYLGRLTSAQKLPEALAVLRKELDRNPNDPLLYEKLANFLDQNKLFAQQEEVYRQAIDKFPGEAWTDKLARFYLRQKRTQDYAALTRKITDTFDGTDVDTYFRQGIGGGAQLYLELNLYAHQRFPHDIVFTENLLNAYNAKLTRNPAAREKLLRETWWQTPDLTNQFFEFLSSAGKLEAELAQLQPSNANPAAQQEAAEVQLWRSHFEESAPLFADLSAAYPADVAIGTTASDLQRSLAWFDSSHSATSVAIEQRLLSANPGDIDRLARIGDILADHADDSGASLAPSAQYWRRMPTVAPGNRGGYLQAATVFWDYFQFDDALAEISAARTHFHQPALYGYEAGAIAEGKRDYPLAVREYLAAALEDEAQEGDAASRLFKLARRPSTRDLVDSASAEAAKSSDPAALKLRLTVLNTLHREGERAPLLANALKSAKTAEAAANIANLARTDTNSTIYYQALNRQADLTTDPVERIQLRYSLARVYEDRNDIPAAARVIETIYHDNPLLLGVVRSTVDFDWRTKHQPQAITVLTAAARASATAQPDLAHQFTAEAAAKANESGDTTQGRALAESLLQIDPYNAEYLSLAADSYVRANDNAGLKQFYLARLDILKTTSMSNDDRKSRTALLRKGLIPALTRAKDYSGAVDQYIALISAYPEDPALNNEAALYALRYNDKQQYIGFLQTTTKASPRDSRFFIDLAEAQQVFADLPAAIDAYTHAIAIRKDRTDLYTAKASLEETLQRFDDAVADYQRLYQLTYKDPQWMIAIARVRARQNRATDAADALKTAYLSGPKQAPDDFFHVASQLEQWNFLDDAARFAEQGRAAAGDHFLTADIPGVSSDDASIYARILTRQRHTEPLLATLHAAASDALTPLSPSIIAAEIQSRGLGSVTDGDWRQQAALRHYQATNAGLARALTAAGAAVDTFYTPEERATYAPQLDQQHTGADPQHLATIWIPAAHAAGLAEKEAAWRKEAMLASDKNASQDQEYTTLQTSRMRFTELAQTLEAFLKLHSKSVDTILPAEATAYRNAGDAVSETRVLHTIVTRNPAESNFRTRYLDLLVHRDTPALIALSGSRNEVLADAAANFAFAKAAPKVALAVINARGKALPAVWTPATSGLAGLFFADTTGASDTALRIVLAADATIADRLATKPDTTHQLTGELWFYYASRDAQLRLLAPTLRDSAEDVIAADLEYAPDAANYESLAQTYAEAGNAPAALAELDHVLELDPHSADTQDARALILWNAGRKDEALAAWRDALASLRVIEDRAAATEAFWSGFARIGRHLHDHGIAAQFKPQMDDVLRIYIKRNGNYRSNELLHAAYAALPDTDWIISLAGAAVDPLNVLQDLNQSDWLPPAARETMLLHEIQLAQSAVPANAAADDYARTRVSNAQDSLIKLYVAQHGDARALTLLRALDPTRRNTPDMQHTEAVLAARLGQLDALLANYRSQPDAAPSVSVLQAAAAELAGDNRPQPARALLEFAFDRSLSTHTLASTDYLALAEARLHTNDLAGALSLLHSLIQTSGDTYANLDSAAALLEKNGHPAEAVPFLTTLAQNVPWDLSYTARLSEAQQHEKDPAAPTSLAAVAHNPLAPYALRTRAARDLAGTGAPRELGSAELKLLASTTIAPIASQQPFFVAARVAAAAQSHDAKQQAALLREAIAISPNNPQILLDLFRAEVRANDATGARVVLDVMLPSSSYYPTETDADNGSDDATDYNVGALLPPVSASLPLQERIQLAKDIAELHARDGDTTSATNYLRLAIRLAAHDDARVAALRSRIAAIEAADRLEAANTARRPVIHKTLDQALTVRQRLIVAPDEAPPAPKKGEE